MLKNLSYIFRIHAKHLGLDEEFITKMEHTKDYEDKETKISGEGSSFFLSCCRRVKSVPIFKRRKKKFNLPKEACFKILSHS